MRLIKVELCGYKRFAGATTLYVNGPVVAVVGPNEAGKTSLLEALVHLSHETGFDRRQFTDRMEPPADKAIVTATYALEQEDRAALDVGLANQRIEFTVRKDADGELVPELHHELHRDMDVRADARRRLKSALDRSRLKNVFEQLEIEEGQEPPEEVTSIEQRARRLADGLDSQADELPGAVAEDLQQVQHALQAQVSDEANRELQNLRDVITALRQSQDAEHPQGIADRTLLARQPQFLLFRQRDQDLRFNYRWEDHPDNKPPAALTNLLGMADADYSNLAFLGTDEDRKADLHTEQKRVNRTLRERMDDWGQRKLTVALHIDQVGIEVQIEDRETDRLMRFNEGSAGLQRYVALVAFVYRYAEAERTNPVLLLDEAETHLHYEAQAELVRVLERQAAAQTVIYTTHSIGCLPEDLGAAIRVVETLGHERSRILVSAWTSKIGLSPLVLAMGANALAFTPARSAVIGEGASEAILLPTLFRQARPRGDHDQPIGFQVAPGISEVHGDDAAELEGEAGFVVYLIDSDDGGRQHGEKLPQRAHGEGRVIEVRQADGVAVCTEDFIKPRVFAEAFNSVIEETRPRISDRITADELPQSGRGAWIRDWCESRGADLISKTHLAERILELGRIDDTPVLDPARKHECLGLHGTLLEKLRPKPRSAG
jgi:predicted ATP-dependent endonuclease of OLD family